MTGVKKKNTALLCCILLMAALLLSALLMAEHVGHHCSGLHCTICALLNRSDSLLRQGVPLAFGVLFVQVGLLAACSVALARPVPASFFNPIAFNVRMND